MSGAEPTNRARKWINFGSKGTGWGGPARSGNGNPQTFFDGTTNAQGHSVATPKPANRRAMRLDQAEDVKDKLLSIALDGENENTQVSACVAFLNRVEGMPTVTLENIVKPPAKMSREELDIEIAAERERVRVAAEG